MKRQFLLTILLLNFVAVHAQKSSKETLPLKLIVSPLKSRPETNIKFQSEIRTPLDPLSNDDVISGTYGPALTEQDRARAAQNALKAYAVKYLDLGTGYNKVSENADWAVLLTTSDVTTTFVSTVPASDLQEDDALFKYTFYAKLLVTDKLGNAIVQENVVDEKTEQVVTKRMLSLNPVFKVKLQMTKNKPAMQKKIVDNILERKSHLVLQLALMKADELIADTFKDQYKNIPVSLFGIKGKDFESVDAANEKVRDAYNKITAFSSKKRISKADFDNVLKDAIPVWEKYVSYPGLEDKASKGMSMNIGLAYAIINDFDKASVALDAVPETKVNPEELYEVEDNSSNAVGLMLGFEQSAAHVRHVFNVVKRYGERIKYND